MEIVSAMRRALADKVGQDRLAVWFGRGVRMEPCGTTLRIAAADTRLSFLRRNLHAELAAAARELGVELEFVVDNSAVIDSEAEVRDQRSEVREQKSASDALTSDLRPLIPAPPRQPRRQFASLADFVASDMNRVALSVAKTAVERPGAYTPLTIVGPPGSGKTHLLEGIWREVRQSRSVSRVIYLTAEQFTNQFLEAIRHSGMPNFRRKVRDAEMLLIDDIQFFAGKQSTLIELANTIDALLRTGRQIVFAIDRTPSELPALGPELIARLSGGLICTLEPADGAARLSILQQLAVKQDVAAPPDVLVWLAGQLTGDARVLAGALNRLKAASEAHERTIDLEFAQSALADLIHSGRRPVRLPEIVDAVCDVLGVGADELKSSSKSSSVTLPRMLAMFLARKWTRAALSEISRSVGRRSHTTVLSAQKQVNEWLTGDKRVPLTYGSLRVEDAIKRIETHLRLA
jgi:chromosomal replication initiator protein